MSTLSLAAVRPTLVDKLLSRSITTDVVLVAAGAALTSVAAQLVIPIWPVPITAQTFAVLLVGTALGPIRGALSMVLYAILGVVGLPVFAAGHSGNLFGYGSGGFVIGFIFAAALVGWLAQRQWDHKVIGTFVAFVAGTAVMYAIGLPWLFAVISHFSPALMTQYFGTTDVVQATFGGGVVPFLFGDLIKAVLAAALLPVTWKLVSRADRVENYR